MAKREYRGYYFEKSRGGCNILTDLQEEELVGHRAFAGRSPTLSEARAAVDSFISGKATPWYETRAFETLGAELEGEYPGLLSSYPLEESSHGPG